VKLFKNLRLLNAQFLAKYQKIKLLNQTLNKLNQR